jgi:hypothetical protein
MPALRTIAFLLASSRRSLLACRRLLAVADLLLMLPAGSPMRAAHVHAASPIMQRGDVADGSLLRGPPSGKLYLVYAGIKHPIDTAATLAALGLSVTSVVTVTAAVLHSLPVGAALNERFVLGQPWPFALIASGGPLLFANPPAAASGAIVQLSGAHFGVFETVQLRYSDGQGALDVLADGRGTFSAPIVLPPDEAQQTTRIYAYGTRTRALAVEPFTIIPVADQATLAARPPVLSPGEMTRLSGSGFAPDEQVNIFYAYGRALVVATADATGTFAGVTLTVPLASPASAAWTVAYGRQSKRTASIYLDVQTVSSTLSHLDNAQDIRVLTVPLWCHSPTRPSCLPCRGRAPGTHSGARRPPGDR